MKPEEYESCVAEMLRAEGWRARVTPYVHDFGIDIIAERGKRRLGVQAKMYAGNRPINGAMVMQVYGAAAYVDCSDSMIATDGVLLDDARKIAEKLGVEIRTIPATAPDASALEPASESDVDRAGWTFGHIWEEHVAPLAGTTLARADGKTNEILRVDEGGLVRRTSSGRTQRIEIEIFRWTIERLIRGDTVLRDEINAQYPGRASSGIMLVLSSLPMFDETKIGNKKGIRMRSDSAV